MARYSSAVPLQFAIIAFPGKWVALGARAGSWKGRATNVIAFGTPSNDFTALAMIGARRKRNTPNGVKRGSSFRGLLAAHAFGSKQIKPSSFRVCAPARQNNLARLLRFHDKIDRRVTLIFSSARRPKIECWKRNTM